MIAASTADTDVPVRRLCPVKSELLPRGTCRTRWVEVCGEACSSRKSAVSTEVAESESGILRIRSIAVLKESQLKAINLDRKRNSGEATYTSHAQPSQ